MKHMFQLQMPIKQYLIYDWDLLILSFHEIKTHGVDTPSTVSPSHSTLMAVSYFRVLSIRQNNECKLVDMYLNAYIIIK